MKMMLKSKKISQTRKRARDILSLINSSDDDVIEKITNCFVRLLAF